MQSEEEEEFKDDTFESDDEPEKPKKSLHPK